MIPFWRNRSFLTGTICGGIVIGLVWTASTWLNATRKTRGYDQRLVSQRGNTTACDAIMRMRDAYERLKKQ
jgi:hypothetical protein